MFQIVCFLLFISIISNGNSFNINPIHNKLTSSNRKNFDFFCKSLNEFPFPEVKSNNKLVASHFLIPLSTNLILAQSVLAKDGEYGILEGKWAGLLHPISLLGLYVVSISAAYYGLRWRRSRTIGKLINGYNSSPNDSNVSIEELKAKQKALSEGDPKNKHVILGSILLGSGTALAFEGGLSTYWRVGELFPDTHLFAGMGLVIIWALSYSLSPFMSKGQDWARNTHLTLNLAGLAIYTWQILSGWEIMVNVFNEVPGW